MEEKQRRYEIVIKNSVSILNSFVLLGIIILILIVLINNNYNVPKVWNISFLTPIFVVYFASLIQLIIAFWSIGNYNSENIERSTRKKSHLIFSSCITYVVFLGLFSLYCLFSVIFF